MLATGLREIFLFIIDFRKLFYYIWSPRVVETSYYIMVQKDQLSLATMVIHV